MQGIDDRIRKVKNDKYVMELFRKVPKDIYEFALRGYVQQGGIVIDCENENPERVKNLLVRSLSMLYSRISLTEYNGTSCKRDDYIRDLVEKVCCKPIIEDSFIYAHICDSGEGARIVFDEYGNQEEIGCPYFYQYDQLTTFDHAFNTFYGKSGDISFVAYVYCDNPYGPGDDLVFYTENGKVKKIVLGD